MDDNTDYVNLDRKTKHGRRVMRIREGQEKLSLIIKTSFKKKKKNTRIEVGCAREVLELKEQRCDNDLGLGSSEYRKTVITVLTVIEWIFH